MTTCPTRSSSTACTPLRRRSGVASSSASVSCGSRDGESRPLAPELSADEVELAWRVGSADAIDPGESEAAADAYLALLAAFERRDGAGARAQAARDVARVATHAAAGSRARLTARALRLDPGLPTRTLARRRDRRSDAATRREAEGWLRRISDEPGRSDPRRSGLSRADAVPGAASRSRRRQLGDRPDGDLRRRHRRRSDVARRAEAPRRLPARSPSSRERSASCITTTR